MSVSANSTRRVVRNGVVMTPSLYDVASSWFPNSVWEPNPRNSVSNDAKQSFAKPAFPNRVWERGQLGHRATSSSASCLPRLFLAFHQLVIPVDAQVLPYLLLAAPGPFHCQAVDLGRLTQAEHVSRVVGRHVAA